MAFLDTVITLDTWEESLKTLVENDTEERLFNMYLHSFPQCSFDEWKKNVLKSNEKQKPLTQEEVATIVNNGEQILKNFQNERRR